MKSSLLCWIICFTLVLFCPVVRASSRRGVIGLSDIVAAQARCRQQIRSLQARFEAENSLTADYVARLKSDLASRSSPSQHLLPRAVQRWQAVYACKGEKYFCRQKAPNPRAPSPPAVLYDGKASYYVTYLPSRRAGAQVRAAATKASRKSRPFPHVLSFGYQVDDEDSQWISDLLRHGSYHLAGTTSDPRFGALYRVEGQYRDDEVALWFAPRFGFLAVRAEVHRKDGRGYRSVYRVIDVKRAGDLWFARTAVREMLHLPTNTLDTRYTIHVSDIKLNAVPDSLFDPALPEGASLYDQDANVLYNIGAAGDKIVDKKYEAWKRKSLHLAMGWLFVASLASLLMLGMRSFVQWRRLRAVA